MLSKTTTIEYRQPGTTIHVDREDVVDLIGSSFEGGSHWIDWIYVNKPETEGKPREKWWDWRESTGCQYLQEVVVAGATLTIGYEDGDWTLFDGKMIPEYLNEYATKYPDSYRRWKDGNYDAYDGDLFVQLCVFGEEVYC